MTIFDNIVEHRSKARKASDTTTVTILGTLQGEIQNQWSRLPADKRGNSPDDTLTGKVVISFVNNLKESLKIKETGEGIFELSILQTYLPKTLTDLELETIIHNRLAEYTDDKGNKIKFVMDLLKNSYANQYDGKLANQLIKNG